jgi:hypothetical protein
MTEGRWSQVPRIWLRTLNIAYGPDETQHISTKNSRIDSKTEQARNHDSPQDVYDHGKAVGAIRRGQNEGFDSDRQKTCLSDEMSMYLAQ